MPTQNNNQIFDYKAINIIKHQIPFNIFLYLTKRLYLCSRKSKQGYAKRSIICFVSQKLGEPYSISVRHWDKALVVTK